MSWNLFKNLFVSTNTGTFQVVSAGASIFTSVYAGVASSYFYAQGGGACTLTSINATAGTSNFSTLVGAAFRGGAAVLTSVTASAGSGNFSTVNAGASILTSISLGTSTTTPAGYGLFCGGAARISGAWVGVRSNNIASTGTAVVLAISATMASSAGYLTFVFTSGTSAFVPFFLSGRT